MTSSQSEAVQQNNAVDDAVQNVGIHRETEEEEVKQEQDQEQDQEQEQIQEQQHKVSFVDGVEQTSSSQIESANKEPASAVAGEEQAQVKEEDQPDQDDVESDKTGSSDEADLVDAATAPGFSSTTLEGIEKHHHANNEEDELPGYVHTGHEVVSI